MSEKHQDLFDYMAVSWRKPLRSIRMDRRRRPSLQSYPCFRKSSGTIRSRPTSRFQIPGLMALVIPYQGLTVNGWADRVGAKVYLEALNAYGEENRISSSSKLAMLASPHDPIWSASEI